VMNFVADPATSPAWTAAASAMFPGAEIRFIGGPGEAGRGAAWLSEEAATRGAVARRSNPGGPIVCHVGAGSPAKRWPLARWAELLKGTHELWVVLAGEVEAERLTPDERRVFRAIGGRVCGSLDELATTLVAARVFVGADTGPTHLAAQLGVPTLALFGPTEPGVWAPVGPRVAVLAPRRPCGMEWLDVEDVRSALASLQT
jgi:ADP-heptose:LPS heptosyltransferase